MFELTTAIAAHIDMMNPRRPAMSDDDLVGLLRSQPGYRKAKARR
jgi:hypothetical protein